VIGRDHLDTGSVASPYRETEAMIDTGQPFALALPLEFLDRLNILAGKDWIKSKGIIYSLLADGF